ncbi:hypothetical protein [Brevibacillus massiliensis]|jgi:hypothetical protein|uniref:hypothetical protein n=1 Tax=Brevibacillus massiliensis TaxID=1118054 RepID=UPI000311D14D|nr:hypothetical protein [Brevibacillus massiliensis]
MTAYNQLEYSNVAVWFDRPTLKRLLQVLVENGLDISWREEPKQLCVLVKTTSGSYCLTLHRQGEAFKLSGLDGIVLDMRLATVLYQFIEQAKGHAVVKIVGEHQILVKNIRYGEAVRIIEIKGAEKKVIYEKACSVTIDQVIAALKRRDAEERIPVLRLELDYELATLYDALQANDKHSINKSKDRLKKLRREMLLLEA